MSRCLASGTDVWCVVEWLWQWRICTLGASSIVISSQKVSLTIDVRGMVQL